MDRASCPDNRMKEWTENEEREIISVKLIQRQEITNDASTQ